jgi:endonuclease/exonuclease/phosphatase family metal-dependent hydrolase
MRPTTVFIVVLAGLILVCLAGGLRAEQRLTIAAYNVENAFDVFDNPYADDHTMEPKPRWAWEALAAAIRSLDADVIGISEVENEHVLRAMAQELLPDMGYRYITSLPTNSGRGINLGVMSRRPILRVASYRFRELSLPGDQRRWRFARDLLHVTIQATDEHELDVIVVHFKSKRETSGDPQSAAWRLAEATEARRIIEGILEREPDRLLAIVGDFNDTPDSRTLATLKADGLLTDAHTELPPRQRITFLHEPFRSTIDYILASPALAARLVPGSAIVPTDPELLKGSDHAPVAATFDLSN